MLKAVFVGEQTLSARQIIALISLFSGCRSGRVAFWSIQVVERVVGVLAIQAG